MHIGALAKQAGVSSRMLRYYEEQGVLIPTRSSANYRIYTPEDMVRLKRIILLNRAGLSLETIRSVLECKLPDDGIVDQKVEICDALRSKIEEKTIDIDQQIQELEGSRQLLRSYLGEMPG